MATDVTIDGDEGERLDRPTDAALVEAAPRGDRTAFAELFQRRREMLIALCRRALGSCQAGIRNWLSAWAFEELAVGLEPTTCCLQDSCSAN